MMKEYRAQFVPAFKLPAGSRLAPVQIDPSNIEAMQLAPPDGGGGWRVHTVAMSLLGQLPMLWVLWEKDVLVPGGNGGGAFEG